MNNVIFTILYNKELIESSTLNSLSLLELSGGDYTLVIVNNGPKEINCNLEGLFSEFDAIFYECFLDNIPLSKLYNYLLTKYSAFDRFVLFDDDTLVPKSFFSTLDESFSSGVDMQLPKIRSSYDQAVYYPLLNGVVDDSKFKNYRPEEEVYSIGSGMVIYKTLLEKLKRHNELPFDESFALYGVDMSIFKIMRKLYVNNEVTFRLQLASEINHSLSRISNVDNKFRRRERVYDSILSSLIYPRSFLRSGKVVVKSLWKCIFHLDVVCLFNIIKIFFTKKHPRC